MTTTFADVRPPRRRVRVRALAGGLLGYWFTATVEGRRHAAGWALSHLRAHFAAHRALATQEAIFDGR
ncbi:hypothetical protein [Agromyces larvae]|uniref:Uncharacterized protein n=1 Tax=Agromyces larvae TaxID=2929802 RepID=A0ABY4C3C0_9MICO|nr:hypothetical protein [Agromyces larvae]UOE45972.1 hypothetical protein MTO99_09585 [Agromyces larvae]